MNVEKTVSVWEAQALKEAESKGMHAVLQTLVERVSVFLRALGSISEGASRVGESMGNRFAQYAMLLTDQGRSDIADKYAQIVSSMTPGKIIIDRIFHSKRHAAGEKAPPFPFNETKAVAAPVKAAPTKSSSFGAAPANSWNAAPVNNNATTFTNAAPQPSYNAPAAGGYNQTNAYTPAPTPSYTPAPTTNGYGNPSYQPATSYGAPTGYGGKLIIFFYLALSTILKTSFYNAFLTPSL